MNFLVDRIKEPSTAAGLAIIAAMFGVNIDEGALAQTLQGLSLFLGGAAVVVKEVKGD